MATAARKPSQAEQLAAQFEPAEHKSRSQGGQQLIYISIDATINRLNTVLGTAWSTDANTTLREGFTTVVRGEKVPAFLAQTELILEAEIDGNVKKAYGVGATIQTDPDMAAKTALAEAIKKACHQLGIGLYLWDATTHDEVAAKMKLVGASEATLKGEVFKLAVARLEKGKPTAKEIATLFGVTPGELADKDALRAILTKEGLL